MCVTGLGVISVFGGREAGGSEIREVHDAESVVIVVLSEVTLVESGILWGSHPLPFFSFVSKCLYNQVSENKNFSCVRDFLVLCRLPAVSGFFQPCALSPLPTPHVSPSLQVSADLPRYYIFLCRNVCC